MRVRIDPREALLDFLPVGSKGAEIGVHMGDFSDRILKVVRPAELHLIDPWKTFDEDRYEKSWYSAKSVAQSEMDARHKSVCHRFKEMPAVKVHRKMSASAAAEFPDGHFDWVYIDGDHTYEGVTADIRSYGPKLKKNGLLIGDDYTFMGWWKRGVIDAFGDAIASRNYFVAWKLGTQIAIRKI